MTQIKSKGFLVTYTGDETVGMLPLQWQIAGDFTFDCQADLDIFKRKIAQAFEFCSDTPIIVESLEEISARIKREL